MICSLDAIGIHVPHSLSKLVQLLLVFFSILLPNEAHAALTLIRDWLETLECIQMFKCSLLLSNRLARAIKLGEAFYDVLGQYWCAHIQSFCNRWNATPVEISGP